MNKHSKEFVLKKLEKELLKKQKAATKLEALLQNQTEIKTQLETTKKHIEELTTAINEFQYIH